MQKYNFKKFLGRYNENVEELSLFKLLKEMPTMDSSCEWLAGGAIRRTITGKALDSDFDFFFKTERARINFELGLADFDFVKLKETNTNVTYSKVLQDGTKIIVQVIFFKYYNSIEDVLDSFDFTITQFGYDGNNLYCGEYSLFDLLRKRLAIHELSFGVSTLRRVIKYTNQGFTACGGVLTDILQRVVDHPEVINSKVISVD